MGRHVHLKERAICNICGKDISIASISLHKRRIHGVISERVLTSSQKMELEDEFQINPYLDFNRRKEIADKLGLKVKQVKNWFQNRRAKSGKK